jgi:pimeloyl-ACP methyl ester carboxylesterase
MASSPGRRCCPTSPGRFTCYLPSTRGRGLSGDNPDHSPPRLEDDVAAFVDSIGAPVGLVGWSGSGAWVLEASARSGSVAAVAAYEPGVISVMGEDDLARTRAAFEQVGMAAADGRLVDAVRAFAPWICTDEEIAALEETDFYAGSTTRAWPGSSGTTPRPPIIRWAPAAWEPTSARWSTVSYPSTALTGCGSWTPR